MDIETRAELYLLFVTFLWGWTIPLMKIGLQYISTGNFLTYRFIIAVILLLIIYHRNVFLKKTLIPGIILGLALALGQGLQHLD